MYLRKIPPLIWKPRTDRFFYYRKGNKGTEIVAGDVFKISQCVFFCYQIN